MLLLLFLVSSKNDQQIFSHGYELNAAVNNNNLTKIICVDGRHHVQTATFSQTHNTMIIIAYYHHHFSTNDVEFIHLQRVKSN